MSESRSRSRYKQQRSEPSCSPGETPTVVYLGFWLLLFFGTLFVGGPWAGYHSVLVAGAALLMFLFPPAVSLPRIWWILAGLFVIFSMGAFLPVAWFPAPEWRSKLVALGLDAGSHVVIQSHQAAEALFLFVVTLLTGMWLAGHRPSPQQVRLWALMFTSGVAIFAILSKMKYDAEPGAVFGFFPNRNHTATYLAMGAVCGLGCVLQFLRDRRFVVMSISLVVTSICLWAVAGWSISRGGVLLVVIGSLIWVALFGRNYLGKHGVRALSLIVLTVIGFFFIGDSSVKQRISETVERAKAISSTEGASNFEEVDPSSDTVKDLDFRVPIAIDTFDLIKDFKWTGVGAAQFEYIFPQYRKLTAVANQRKGVHPESDWLWMASETGIPAALSLAALVAMAFTRGISGILGGRDRVLRGACLVAALIVPLHGFFDVPGHRVPLAWCSAFLFALSLHIPNDERFEGYRLRRWFFRTASVMVVIYAGFLARSEWWGGEMSTRITAESALKKARALHVEYAALRVKAEKEGTLYDPPPEEDPVERVIDTLQSARKTVPLDGEVLYLLGVTALFFDDRAVLADRSFALQLELNPTWVAAPLQQAEAWVNSDPERARELLKEAIIRAKKLDQLQAETPWSLKRTIIGIQKMPELKGLLPVDI